MFVVDASPAAVDSGLFHLYMDAIQRVVESVAAAPESDGVDGGSGCVGGTRIGLALVDDHLHAVVTKVSAGGAAVEVGQRGGG